MPGAKEPLLDSIRYTLPPKSPTATPTRPLLEAAIEGNAGLPSRNNAAGAIEVHVPHCQPTGHTNRVPAAGR